MSPAGTVTSAADVGPSWNSPLRQGSHVKEAPKGWAVPAKRTGLDDRKVAKKDEQLDMIGVSEAEELHYVSLYIVLLLGRT